MTREVKVADQSTWDDVAALFGSDGAFHGCWCMFWRLSNAEMRAKTAADNRAALQALVCSGAPAGLLLYHSGTPVGWCQVAPRPAFTRLFRTKGLDLTGASDASIWSIVCIFVARQARGTGVADELVSAAVQHASRCGATVVEAYPVGARTTRTAQLSSGTIGLFRRGGFTEPERPAGGRRVVMRREVTASAGS